MRVLTVGNMYPPQHLGGYEAVWQAAVRHLRAAGHDARVLTTRTRVRDAGHEDPDVFRELRWYSHDGEWARPSPPARLALERHNARVFDRHVAELRPDVVTWWSMGGMSLSLLPRARLAGLRAAAFVHDDWLVYGPVADAWLRMLRPRPRAARAAWRLTGVPTWLDTDAVDEWHFVSESTWRTAERALGALRGAVVTHSGISPEFLAAPAPRPWGWRLLYVGRLDPRKGIETAIDALAHLPEEATLTVAGAGDEAQLAARAPGRITFAGSLGRAALKEAYAAADVVVFPVVWDEPWGLVPLEAMGMRRPVVATGRGGSAEYLRDGHNALVHPAGDAAALAAAVRRLAGDPALRERLAEAGRATAARHTEERLNAAVLAAVERLGVH